MKSFWIAAGLALAAMPAAAQVRPHLQADQRIRITTLLGDIASTKSATVLEDSGDTLTLQIEGVQQRVPVASVQVLEISLGRGSRRSWLWKGGLAGTAAGTATGLLLHGLIKHQAVIGFTGCPGQESSNGCPRYGFVHDPISRFAPLVGVGAVLGAAGGFLLPGDRWQKVPVRPTVAVAPSARGIAISLRR